MRSPENQVLTSRRPCPLHTARTCGNGPRPVSSIFVVPRSLTTGTFTLTTIEKGIDTSGDAIVVENWEVVTT